MEIPQPAIRPKNPCFSSGPCTKPPNWHLDCLNNACLGRSHRSKTGRSKLLRVIEEIRDILEVPEHYRIGIVPASDTGAIEMAMWSLLGERYVTSLVWDGFGQEWADDITRQLQLNSKILKANYGSLPAFDTIDFDGDVIFTWNGTTSGACLPNGEFIPADRSGLVLCDATSAAFAMQLPWDKLDATTFSWQKVLGGEAGHGILILSPRAIERLRNWVPPWPLPKIFRLVEDGKINEGIFSGATINTPSMLCVEDFLHSLHWAKSIGGLPALIKRTQSNARAIDDFISNKEWIDYLVVDPAIRSTTSVCLKLSDPKILPEEAAQYSKSITSRLEQENVAYDISSYRSAPPGLRIWCGATVEMSDLEALMPWIEWAYLMEQSVSQQ